jgi:glutamyl-tRNA synthetase
MVSIHSTAVRTRIAPSPTGDPHIGTAYMALFNYVMAEKHGGQFIIRIEDTDQTRYRADSESQILECLTWLGLTWTEGPDKGGPFGPYRQSERVKIHQQHVQILLEKKHAYRCFCTAERLDKLRHEQLASGHSHGYDRHCLGKSDAESELLASEGHKFTVRMKAPTQGHTSFVDKLRGVVTFENATIDDQVLLKSDGFPTYHLANVVDDHLMEISHVIRGEEWLSSTPKHVVLYEMFGWKAPEFAHLSLLRNSDKSKISKRKNPTSIKYYRRKGILPEALLNFLSLMGWSLDGQTEVFSLQQMIEKFELEQVSLGGPIFDFTKLTWINGQYLRKLSNEHYFDRLKEHIFSDAYLSKIIPLAKERVDKLEDFFPAMQFFFNGDLNFDLALLVPKGGTYLQSAQNLQKVIETLETAESWDAQTLHDLLDKVVKEQGLKAKDVYMPLRIAVTGTKESPPLAETLETLGKEMVRRRVFLACEQLLKVDQ